MTAAWIKEDKWRFGLAVHMACPRPVSVWMLSVWLGRRSFHLHRDSGTEI